MTTLLQNLGKALIGCPQYLLQFVIAVIIAILTDTPITLLCIGGVVGVATIGLWVLCPVLALYASLHGFATVVNGITEQINFLARCHRDHA